MAQETLLQEQLGGVLRLTLNRPDKLNSLTPDMREALLSALRAAGENPEVRSVILTGSGRAFCTGQDLNDIMPDSSGKKPDLGDVLTQHYSPIIQAIRQLEKPVLCAVNGIATGAGAGLAFACDLVFAARSAKFIHAFSRLGLVPGAGASFHLPRLVGEVRAKGLLLTGMPVSAEQAADWGLIWQMLEDNQLQDEVLSIATEHAKGPTSAYAMTKHLIHASAVSTLEDQLIQEAEMQRIAGYSQNHAEGLNAFLEKRSPAFK
ncbi:1,2-epoxyphenylacetyl-CoA isomerase [Pseudovibrio axinellae]|uniref:1,2-epoxyphenylacetyl-CoA isomerase n=1 Tax=Pseudovibrio axinellae TaxID=989403 RepID=A0A165SXV9_9HYPH|nr:enoyl-CoA hydratase-related protein [Pseudovibrio axinellae]KZL05000.1 1,2-epoxyphenylacetyl-CoA isomerase [Pseudovibrio axinellae]SER64305.1 short chain enoyl-CoA hydratase /Enoyl-CoA hydratase [Pseudovibrio axinellae]